MAENRLHEYIKDKLTIRNVGPQILEKVNTLIDEAIWELTRSQVIPPVSMEFTSLDKKQEKRNDNGELIYNYYFLPKDFHTLEEFFVDDQPSGEPHKRVPYQFVAYENYIDILKTDTNNRKYFTVADVTIKGENRKVLIANPFPADTIRIIIKYFEDGTESIADRIEKRYWKIVLREIEGELGIRSQQDVDDQRNLEIANRKNQKGKNKVNNTMTTVKSKFFKGLSDRGNKFGRRRRH